MAFEDLLIEKEKFDKRQCPYCKSYVTIGYAIRSTPEPNRLRQKTYCNGCEMIWYVVFNSNMTQVGIEKISTI